MTSNVAGLTCGVAMLLAVMAGVARVSWLEGQEVHVREHVTLAQLSQRGDATASSVRLARARLEPDQSVSFELCAADRMLPERWTGAMAVAVWRPRARELMTRADLSAELLSSHVRRNSAEGCLTIGRGVIADRDVYAVEALWDERPVGLDAVPLTVTIQARRPLGGIDLAIVLIAWLSAVGLVLSLSLRRAALGAPGVPAAVAPAESDRAAPDDPEALDEWEQAQAAARPPLPKEARLALGIVLLVGSFVASAFLPGGAAFALATGVVLALFEASLAVGIAPGPGLRRRVALLALVRPARAYLWFPAALVAGVALWLVALNATALVPSTGESAVQSFVSWPSGLLSFACLAVVVPLAEELFFRGFVYGVLEQRSRALAFAGGALLFIVAHAPQTWGQWGALVAISVTGLGLTTLRATSRSTLVPALAHLVYNGLLAIGAVA